eukprot:5251939-Prymnesium_polylepis.1
MIFAALVVAAPPPCADWCELWTCDGSLWCAGGARPEPCGGCAAKKSTSLVEAAGAAGSGGTWAASEGFNCWRGH